MRINDLIPWRNQGRNAPARRDGTDPVRALQRDIDRAFDNFWGILPFPFPDTGQLGQANTIPVEIPVDVSDNGKEVIVKAELPGMSEDDVDVSVSDDQLTIRGEKKIDRENEEEGATIRERVYGAFERVLPLPEGIEAGSAKATFKNGVLTVALPKTKESQSNLKRVPVNAS